MPDRTENAACLQRHLAAEKRHDMTVTLETLHPECLFEDRPAGLRLHGREGARRHYQLWWGAFRVGLEAGQVHWVRDDLLIGEAEFVGAHIGPFLGIEPTGNDIRLPFIVVVGFRDGLLASERFTYDMNDLLRQLGQPAFDPERAAA